MDGRELEKLREKMGMMDEVVITAEDRKMAGKKFHFWVCGTSGALQQKGAAAFP